MMDYEPISIDQSARELSAWIVYGIVIVLALMAGINILARYV